MALGIARLTRLARFEKAFKRLDPGVQDAAKKALSDLLRDPIPPGRNLELVRGRKDVYSIRVNYHFRMSFQVQGDVAVMRRVAPHDELYSSP